MDKKAFLACLAVVALLALGILLPRPDPAPPPVAAEPASEDETAEDARKYAELEAALEEQFGRPADMDKMDLTQPDERDAAFLAALEEQFGNGIDETDMVEIGEKNAALLALLEERFGDASATEDIVLTEEEAAAVKEAIVALYEAVNTQAGTYDAG